MKTKHIPLVTLILGLFILGMILMANQGLGLSASESNLGLVATTLEAPNGHLKVSFGLFADFFYGILAFTNQNLFWGVLILALLVELVLLYPSAAIELKQKKIHLFHKKLVDQFRSGKLSLSKSKQELDVLYAVNEKLHRRGALLFTIQLVVFLWALLNLVRLTFHLPENWAALSQFDVMLLNFPQSFLIPIVVALGYFFHAIIKIYFKQKEDYIDPWQSRLSFFMSIVISALVFAFASIMPTVLSVYLLTLFTFSTLRYLWVQHHAKGWKKVAHRELVHMLIHTPAHKKGFSKWRVKLNHSAFMRHFNLHMLTEAASMSLVLGLVVIAL